jgi:hypothetical protein
MLHQIEFQFIAGLIIGSGLTFVYVASIAVRFYHPIIKEQQRQIVAAKEAMKNEHSRT